MASDMMPVPAICGLFIHTIWLIVFAPLVAHYDVLTPGRTCGRPGIQYQATCAGFLAIYAASWLGELALFVVGCRGLNFVMCSATSAATAQLSAVLLQQLSPLHAGNLCRHSSGGSETKSRSAAAVCHDSALVCTDCFCKYGNSLTFLLFLRPVPATSAFSCSLGNSCSACCSSKLLVWFPIQISCSCHPRNGILYLGIHSTPHVSSVSFSLYESCRNLPGMLSKITSTCG